MSRKTEIVASRDRTVVTSPEVRHDDATSVVRRDTSVALKKIASRKIVAGLSARAKVMTGGARYNDFVPGNLEVTESPASPARGRVILVLLALFAAALAWSIFGHLAADTTAAGKVQASGRTKVVEAIVKGQVLKIHVRDGDVVKQGQTLIELDPTDAIAARTIVFDKLANMLGETQRCRTEITAARADRIDTGAKPAWDDAIPQTVRQREERLMQARLTQLSSTLETLANQKRAKEAARDKYIASIAAQKALVAVTAENLAMVDKLLQQGWNSRAKYLDLKAQLQNQQVAQATFEGNLADAKQAIVMIDTEIAKTRETFVTTDTQTVVTNEQNIVDLKQQLIKADSTLANMSLQAPVNGVVNGLNVTTIGQVVKGGDQLMQIVPADSVLEIQAYVDNDAVGFIKVGQPATIKVSAFQYSTYGAIDGTVVDIAKDALPAQQKNTVQTSSLDGEFRATTAAQKTGTLQFPVLIKATKNTINVDGKEVPLVPGMTVNVELETEQRRAIDYIVSPILELLSTALHEK